MTKDKGLSVGNTDMLILSLINECDMYGYQIIETLAQRSNHAFDLKTGTLYPLLHLLEQKKYLTSYEAATTTGKARKYYRITEDGRKYLGQRQKEWTEYAAAVQRIMAGGMLLATR